MLQYKNICRVLLYVQEHLRKYRINSKFWERACHWRNQECWLLSIHFSHFQAQMLNICSFQHLECNSLLLFCCCKWRVFWFWTDGLTGRDVGISKKKSSIWISFFLNRLPWCTTGELWHVLLVIHGYSKTDRWLLHTLHLHRERSSFTVLHLNVSIVAQTDKLNTDYRKGVLHYHIVSPSLTSRSNLTITLAVKTFRWKICNLY